MDFADFESRAIRISEPVRAVTDELIELRRYFHRHPELGNQEEETQREILNRLTERGIEARPIAGSGVVGTISGSKPGKTLLLRADMDGLPIQEETTHQFKSENPGIMHACGHDAHLAMLVIAARILAQRPPKKGTVKLMFQPAEEGGGGALKMLKNGILKDPPVDAALAFHVWAPNPLGHVTATDGPIAASIDGFKLTVKGKGTHAAMPEEGIDPIVIASHIITAAQTLITRKKAPMEAGLLSFTSVHGGSAFNIIPETVEILGTFRALSKKTRDLLSTGLQELATSMGSAFGGTVTYENLGHNIPTLNAAEISGLVREVAAGVVGERRISSSDILMVSEDFGEVLDKVPGALILIGCGSEDGMTQFPHHHPRFDINEKVLPIGVELILRFVDKFNF